MLEQTKMLNQIRKWGQQFDGKDPLSFLERIEELRRGYGYEDEQLLLGLPELLKGDALLWYRNYRDSWATWEDFCRGLRTRFLPADFPRKTRQEILNRYQQPGEAFNTYSTALLTLMRRAGGYSEAKKLDQLYENLDPELQLYVRREEIQTIDDLSHRVAHIEAIHRRKQERRTEAPTTKGTVAAATYNREKCCWRCKQRGHTRQYCQRPPKKFCSRCGKDGVLTRDCHPPPQGNGPRAGDTRNVARPDSE
jgi:hypothetical protein